MAAGTEGGDLELGKGDLGDGVVPSRSPQAGLIQTKREQSAAICDHKTGSYAGNASMCMTFPHIEYELCVTVHLPLVWCVIWLPVFLPFPLTTAGPTS